VAAAGVAKATLRKPLDFLAEPWDDAVLDYNSKPLQQQATRPESGL
jgi:hypothetical protein